MNKEEARKRIEAAERELAEARKALGKAEKPLTWPDLEDGSYFKFDNWSDAIYIKLPKSHHYMHSLFVCWGTNGAFTDRTDEPVSRVNLDGTPYKGDPRK